MSGTIWQLNENSNDAVLLYMNNQATTVVNYMFINSKLHMTTVTYNGGGESKANAFKAEIEKLYGVTMTREDGGVLSLERRPAEDSIATISVPGQSPQTIPLPIRSLGDCLSEELGRLYPDEIYAQVVTQGWKKIHPNDD